MSTGVLDVSIELLQEALLLPDDMEITGAYIDVGRKEMRLFVQHPCIRMPLVGEEYRRVELQFAKSALPLRTSRGWLAGRSLSW